MMRRLGVLGWPVAHSRSPAIHNAALADLGLDDWHYQRLPVPPELFEELVRSLPGSGFVGANVTIPHKEAALALADHASETAHAIGAANTLTFAPDGTIAAENTDAPGLIAALGEPPAGKRVLVLGAGGSARAAVWALAHAGAAEVSIWNRTAARAEQLAHELGARAVARAVPADLLVNCTSVGLERGAAGPDSPSGPPDSASGEHESLQPGLEPSARDVYALNYLGLTFDQVGEYSHVVDLAYGSEPTPLLAAARAQGARTSEGLDVLVAQGALSLELWTGRPAPLTVMARAARSREPVR